MSSSNWFWTENQLLENSKFILRAKAIKEDINPKTGLTDYHFKILEIVKTPLGIDLDASLDLTLRDFASSATEWKHDHRKGRASYGKDCKIWTNFKINADYLLFLENSKGEYVTTFHPKALELITTGTSDPWYLKAKKMRYLGKRN